MSEHVEAHAGAWWPLTQGLAISRPILVGSTATPLTPADKLSAPPDHTHRWTVAVRSAASAPLPAVVARGGAPDESATIATRLRDSDMDLHRAVGGADDLSYMIKRVQFRLHETYAQPTRSTCARSHRRRPCAVQRHRDGLGRV